MISEKDKNNILGNENWTDKVRYLPHGVDLEKFKPNTLLKTARFDIGFTGNLSFQANEDAICFFVNDIYPIIQKHIPKVTVAIAGCNPTRSLKKLVVGKDNVSIIANPPKMESVIQECNICIDPLRIGAGLQNKILEAMSCGKAIVATSLANEGIMAENQNQIVIANAKDDFANECIKLLIDVERRNIIGRNARKFVEDGWSWDYYFNLMTEDWIQLKNL